MKKIVSLLTAFMLLCSMSVTAVFAEGAETIPPETMPIRDIAAMTDVTENVGFSGWYYLGKTHNDYKYHTFANRVITKDGVPYEFDDYAITFTSKIQTSNDYIIAFGGTSDIEKAYYYNGVNPLKGTLTVTPLNITFSSGSISQTTAHNLTAGTEYELYISYADGTIVYGIKQKDTEEITYTYDVWNTASNVTLGGTVIAKREGVEASIPMNISSMYIEKELSASIADGLYDINPGEIAVTLGATLAETLPETVTVSDGINSADCAVTRTDDTTVTITVPDDTLAYGIRYCIDLSSITDADGIAAKKLYFRTVDLSTDKYEQITGVTQSWYTESGTLFEGMNWYYDNGTHKLGLFMKSGAPLQMNDFMLSFDYSDKSAQATKFMNVIFGVNPETTTYSAGEYAKANNYNGMAGISTWIGNKYRTFFGNDAITSTNLYYCDQGTEHDLAMAKDKTYNVNISYINKVMTMHVKSSDENVWRKYTKTMSDTYTVFENGYMGFLANFSGEPKNIKLYEPRTSINATIAEGAYDVNPGTVNVTFDYDLGKLPSTVAVSDGTNSVDCAIAASTDDAKTAVITVPNNILTYGTTYTVDLGAVKDYAGIPAVNASFTTIDNPVPADMAQVTGVSWKWYLDNVAYKEGTLDYAFNTENIKIARLMKDGADVKATDFVLFFDYTDNSATPSSETRSLNVVFGVNPETTTYSAGEYAKANNYNGMAGISTWIGNKYRTFFGNDAITSTNLYYCDQGTEHDLAMAKDNKYNFMVSYIDKVITLYVKLSTESTWRKYTAAAEDDYAEIENGHIGLIAKLSGSASSTKLYVPVEDYTVSAPSYDKEAVINGDTVTVSASVTKNLDSAVYTSATIITGLYKNVNGEWLLEKTVSDSKELTTGTAAELSNSVGIPAEGTYKLKSFVWNLDNLYPFCNAAELTLE